MSSFLKDSLSGIIESAFPSTNNQLPQFRAHLLDDLTSFLVAFDESGSPAGVLCFQWRPCRFLTSKRHLLSVGPVATHPDFFGRGVATSLFSRLHDHATLLNIDFICLSGIPDFYLRFGYYPFYDKSKISFKRDDLLKYYIDFNPLYALNQSPIAETIYPLLSYGNSIFQISRSKETWRWLSSIGSSSYYFPNPTYYFKDIDCYLYYTYQASEHQNGTTTIREFEASNQSFIDIFLHSLLDIPPHNETIEVYTSFNSKLASSLRTKIPYTFSSFPHPSARALLKLVSPFSLIDYVHSLAAVQSQGIAKTLSRTLSIVNENSSILKEISGFSAEYFLPSILTGSIYLENLDKLSLDFRKHFDGFRSSSNPPYLCQGDAM